MDQDQKGVLVLCNTGSMSLHFYTHFLILNVDFEWINSQICVSED